MEGYGNRSVYLGYLNQVGLCCQKVVGRGILQLILGTKEAKNTEHNSKILTHAESPVHVTSSLPAAVKGRAKQGFVMLKTKGHMKNLLILKFPHSEIRTC